MSDGTILRTLKIISSKMYWTGLDIWIEMTGIFRVRELETLNLSFKTCLNWTQRIQKRQVNTIRERFHDWIT